ncbi:MAG: histidine phosphatase family protein [Desulfuromonadales bacterium]|nr:histidine phosphatase family protein [Desulfuromonadales bacterium]
MKYLTLIRHAKSDWSDATLNDFDRPLNSRGKKAVPLMADRIAAHGMVPDLLISSPAKRARKTAQLIARQIGIDKEAILFREDMFDARRKSLVEIVSGALYVRHVGLVGHNPGLSDLGQWLCAEAPEWLQTCAVLELELEIKDWKKISRGCAKVLRYDYPKKAL